MENKNISHNHIVINPKAEIIYSSSVGVGGDSEEIRILLFNKRVTSNGNDIEVINESNTQIIMNKKTALKLKELLENYLNDL